MRRCLIPSVLQASACTIRDVGGAVVAHHPLDADPVRAEVGERAAEEADLAHRLLVLAHLDVGEPGHLVHADMNELPTDPASRSPLTRSCQVS